MDWAYIPVVVIAMAILTSAVCGLYWAVKNRQFAQLERSARSIFDAEEPEGRITDSFPGHSPVSAVQPPTVPESISPKTTR